MHHGEENEDKKRSVDERSSVPKEAPSQTRKSMYACAMCGALGEGDPSLIISIPE